MPFPCSTGEAARLLGTSEPRLAETVRRGKVRPTPPIVAGRRLWSASHLLQAARVLGVLTNQLEAQLKAAVEYEAGHGR